MSNDGQLLNARVNVAFSICWKGPRLEKAHFASILSENDSDVAESFQRSFHTSANFILVTPTSDAWEFTYHGYAFDWVVANILRTRIDYTSIHDARFELNCFTFHLKILSSTPNTTDRLDLSSEIVNALAHFLAAYCHEPWKLKDYERIYKDHFSSANPFERVPTFVRVRNLLKFHVRSTTDSEFYQSSQLVSINGLSTLSYDSITRDEYVEPTPNALNLHETRRSIVSRLLLNSTADMSVRQAEDYLRDRKWTSNSFFCIYYDQDRMIVISKGYPDDVYSRFDSFFGQDHLGQELGSQPIHFPSPTGAFESYDLLPEYPQFRYLAYFVGILVTFFHMFHEKFHFSLTQRLRLKRTLREASPLFGVSRREGQLRYTGLESLAYEHRPSRLFTNQSIAAISPLRFIFRPMAFARFDRVVDLLDPSANFSQPRADDLAARLVDMAHIRALRDRVGRVKESLRDLAMWVLAIVALGFTVVQLGQPIVQGFLPSKRWTMHCGNTVSLADTNIALDCKIE